MDTTERVDRLLERLKEMVTHGLITVEDTRVVHHVARPVRDVSAATTAGDLVADLGLRVTPEEPLDAVVRKILEHPQAAESIQRHGLLTALHERIGHGV